MSKRWIAFFSQTGSEINEVSKRLNKCPDVCYTNQPNLDKVNSELLERCSVVSICKVPTEYQYIHSIGYPTNTIVTLNGWLRIVPNKICEVYEIYNGHPGLITKYPELKGKDPQQKAIDLNLETSGCVIHKVVAEVDSGSILSSKEVQIKGLSTDQVFKTLHNTSIELWVEFLKNKL